MPEGKLRVLAKGTAQVPNYEAQDGGINARITHMCLPLGPQFLDDESKTMKRHAAFVKHVGKVIEVPVRAEYIRHLRDGDLWPADPQTAAMCGVKFDPKFGGEHDDAAKGEHYAALRELAGNDPEMKAHIARCMPDQASKDTTTPPAPAPAGKA